MLDRRDSQFTLMSLPIDMQQNPMFFGAEGAAQSVQASIDSQLLGLHSFNNIHDMNAMDGIDALRSEINAMNSLNNLMARSSSVYNNNDPATEFARRMSLCGGYVDSPMGSPIASFLGTATPLVGSPVNLMKPMQSFDHQFDLSSIDSNFMFPMQQRGEEPAEMFFFDQMHRQQQQQQQQSRSNSISPPGFQLFPSIPPSPSVSPQQMQASTTTETVFESPKMPQPTATTSTPATPRRASIFNKTANTKPAARSTLKLANEAGLDVVLSTPPTSPQHVIARRASIDMNNKPARFKPTDTELVMLTAIFQKNPFPSTSLRKKLADKMGLDIKQVQFWFQNRRATMKTSGVHVIKPKRGTASSVLLTKKRLSLSPLSNESPYFYVETGALKSNEAALHAVQELGDDDGDDAGMSDLEA